MATNLSINPDLLERALQVSGERTKKAAVTRALEEFIARREQKKLIDLFGALEWDAGYDYKADRDRGLAKEEDANLEVKGQRRKRTQERR